jgi:hypothetical protein
MTMADASPYHAANGPDVIPRSLSSNELDGFKDQIVELYMTASIEEVQKKMLEAGIYAR